MDGGPPPDSSAPPDATDRDTGVSDSSAGDAVVPPPPTDSGPLGCTRDSECPDDGNPCTDDLCVAGLCEHPANTAVCDDGIFCNGTEQCSDGTCSGGSGEICIAGTVCDEASGSCTGCATASDCPLPVLGPWSSCTASAGVCVASGSHTRTVTSFSCEAGVCVGRDSAQTGPCTRATDGLRCAPTDYSAWSDCIGCAGGGMQARTRIESLCSAGACDPVYRTESRICSSGPPGTSCTDGMCMYGTCSASGACDFTGSTCDVGEMCCGVGGMCAPPGFC